jgi:hypothetical protein
MIPGAFALRDQARVREPDHAAGALGPHALPADPGDLERREREQEGGGAPPHDQYREHSGASNFIMRALLGLTERFIRLMRTTPSIR